MTPTTKAGQGLLEQLDYDFGEHAGWYEAAVLAIEAEATAMAEAVHRIAEAEARAAAIAEVRREDWHAVLLDALCDSDGGNNPFYRDDPDTVALAAELASVVRHRLEAPRA